MENKLLVVIWRSYGRGTKNVIQFKKERYFTSKLRSKCISHGTVSLCWYLVPSSYIQIFILLPSFLNLSLPLIPLFSLPFKGEGNEEISNMIHNYIKEIEDLRYLHNTYLDNF